MQTSETFFREEIRRLGSRMNALEFPRLVRAAPPGRTDSTNTPSQDSPPRRTAADFILGYSRRVHPGRKAGFDWLDPGTEPVLATGIVHANALRFVPGHRLVWGWTNGESP